MKLITKHLHIMLADDDADDTMLFQDALSEVSDSAIFSHAPNGRELMTMLGRPAQRKPDFLFLDLNMPIRNGYECLRDIREQRDRLGKVTVIVLTTSNLKSSIDKVFGLGAACYVVKPNSYKGLKSAISNVLQRDWSVPSGAAARTNFVMA